MGYKHQLEDVLDVGMELIRKQGYHQVGLNQILKASGIPKGSFYHFFQSKEDFVQQVLQRYGERYYQFIANALTKQEIAPTQRLQSFYALLIDANEQDEFQGGCLLHNLSAEIGHQNENVGQTANHHFNNWISLIAACVAEGQQMGEINRQFSAEALAEYLHTSFFGCLARVKTVQSRALLDQWLHMSFAFIKA